MRPEAKSRPAVDAVWMLVCALVVAALAMLALAGVAGADALTPDSGPTQNSQDTDTLYKIVLSIGLVTLVAIWGLLLVSLVRFRAGRNERQASQIRGNNRIEWSWVAVPTAIVVAIIVITLLMLPDIKNPAASGPDSVAQARGLTASVDQPSPPDGKGLEINVSGQQYLWRFQYPNGAVSFHDLVVPKDTTVSLTLRSVDVAHSWWIPELGGKFEALPGLNNETWFKATETGSFSGQCAELCGSNHTAMTARVTVVEPDQYRAFVKQLKADIDEARNEQQRQSKEFQKEDA